MKDDERTMGNLNEILKASLHVMKVLLWLTF
jgi:hypothetical protein